MGDIGGHKTGIALRDQFRFIADRKFETAAQNIGCLRVHMLVHFTDCSFFKIHFEHHETVIVAQDGSGGGGYRRVFFWGGSGGHKKMLLLIRHKIIVLGQK